KGICCVTSDVETASCEAVYHGAGQHQVMWPPAGHVDQWEDLTCSAMEKVPRHFRSRRYIPAPLFTMVSRRRKQFELIIVESASGPPAANGGGRVREK